MKLALGRCFPVRILVTTTITCGSSSTRMNIEMPRHCTPILWRMCRRRRPMPLSMPLCVTPYRAHQRTPLLLRGSPKIRSVKAFATVTLRSHAGAPSHARQRQAVAYGFLHRSRRWMHCNRLLGRLRRLRGGAGTPRLPPATFSCREGTPQFSILRILSPLRRMLLFPQRPFR